MFFGRSGAVKSWRRAGWIFTHGSKHVKTETHTGIPWKKEEGGLVVGWCWGAADDGGSR